MIKICLLSGYICFTKWHPLVFLAHYNFKITYICGKDNSPTLNLVDAEVVGIV